MKRLGLALTFVILTAAPARSGATLLKLSKNAAAEVLSETVPAAFAPAPFKAEDYAVQWISPALKGVELRIVPGSLQWVRTRENLVLPRAQISVTAEGLEGGQMNVPGFTIPLDVVNGSSSARFMAAMISGPSNAMKIRIKRHGKIETGEFEVKLTAETAGPKVFLDASCSRTPLKVEGADIQSGQWVYVSCRSTESRSAGHLEGALDLVLFWDGLDDAVTLNAMPAAPAAPSVWTARLSPDVTAARFESGSSRLSLTARIPKIIHRGAFAVGLGPYAASFQSPTDNFSGVVPVGTLYGSFGMSETSRAVVFGEVTGSPQIYSDFGAYYDFETAKTLDNRLTINLLIGGHGLGYQSGGVYYGRLDLPQGVEFVLSDVFRRSFNLSGGAFLQPSVGGTSYYNVWLRWGSASYFIETNFIYWTDTTTVPLLSRNAGLTFGFPLFNFL